MGIEIFLMKDKAPKTYPAGRTCSNCGHTLSIYDDGQNLMAIKGYICWRCHPTLWLMDAEEVHIDSRNTRIKELLTPDFLKEELLSGSIGRISQKYHINKKTITKYIHKFHLECFVQGRRMV